MLLLVSCKDASQPKIWIIAEDWSEWANKHCLGLHGLAYPQTYWNPAATRSLRQNYLSPNHNLTGIMLSSRALRPATHPGKRKGVTGSKVLCYKVVIPIWWLLPSLPLLVILVIPPSVMSQWDANRLPNKPFGEHKDITCFMIPKENI